MKIFWQSYKVAIILTAVIFVGYGGYRGFVAFQSYEANQINAAVQLKTNQIEQQFSSMQVATSVVNASPSTTVNNRVSQLETEIQKLQAAPAGNVQVAALQKQVAAIKNASSGPVITYVNPTIMIAGYTNTISINGTGFETNAKVKLGDTGLQTSGTITPVLISAIYPSGFNPGTYDVTVTNPDGGQFTYPSAITINPGTQTSVALTTAQVVAAVSPSVVLIRTAAGCGTGMVVQQGGVKFILTDYHVISDDPTNIAVFTPDGTPLAATLIGAIPSDDLALLSINDTSLPAVTFGDSSDVGLPLGSSVVAIGYPLTCNTDQTLDIEPGAVTARRSVPALIYQGEFIQTSARINPGDSGGPLVNSQGQVVGIDNGIISIDGLNLTGLAFAIPISVEVNDFGTNGAAFLNNGVSTQSNSVPIVSTAPTNSQASVNVSVEVNNSQGGTAKPSDFTVTIIGSNPSISSFPGDASGTQVIVDAEKFLGINVSLLPNYTELTNGECNQPGGLFPGQIETCVISEVYTPSSN